MAIDEERHEELKEEISNLQQVDLAISEIIDAEETEKEKKIYIEKRSISYHELKVSDLPMIRMYEGFNCEWYYRLDIVDGKQVAMKIVVDKKNGCSLINVLAEDVLDPSNKPAKEHQWMLACASVLNYMTLNKKPEDDR
tara:strand:- start:480 stop:896 length:417 start_codon:yes stop_codon:yes gene_type:complete